jgi:hypothetical protein
MNKNKFVFVLVVLSTLFLDACAPATLRVKDATDTNTIGTQVTAIFTGAKQPVPNPIDAPTLAQVGYQLVDSSCSDYFDAVTKASNGWKMTKADFIALGAATATIAALAKASAKQVGIAAASFGFGGLAIDNIEQYAYATPYPIQTRGLISKAFIAYRQSSPPKSAATIPDAIDQIAGYANLCTYAGIASLVEDSISKATPVDASAATPLFSDKDKTQFIQPINKALKIPAAATATDNDYVVLAVICDPTATDDAQLKALIAMLSKEFTPAFIQSNLYDDSVKPPVKRDLTSAWGLFSSLMASNPPFAAKVASTKASTKPGATTPPASNSGNVPPIRIL